MVHVGRAMVERVRQRFVSKDLTAALSGRPRSSRHRELGPHGKSVLETQAPSESPVRPTHWTKHLLAKLLVDLIVVKSVPDEERHKLIKKSGSNPGSRRSADPGSWDMEDIRVLIP